MPTFTYTARTPTGGRTTGAVEAASEAAAIRLLDEQRLFPIRVKEQEKSARLTMGGVRTRELSTFFEQLADLLHAGVPMLRAFETLVRTHHKGRLNVVLTQIHGQVAEGKALSDAMAEIPGVFSILQIAMVRAGERGGFLEEVLVSLAGYLERQDELRGRVRGAMIYPVLLLMIGGGVVSLLLVWMVPKFKTFFEGMELPLPSQILFGASDMVVEYWPTTLTGLFLAGVGGMIFFGSETGKSLWAQWQLRIPVIGRTILMVSLTRFCRILGTMLASGVPILQALHISRDAVGAPRLASAIDEAAKSVREGQGLTEPLRRSQLVPEQILEMVAVAEESNQLEKVLLKIADTVERRTNQQVDQAVRLLEPLILTALALCVLVIALGLLYPIFTMARTIR